MTYFVIVLLCLISLIVFLHLSKRTHKIPIEIKPTEQEIIITKPDIEYYLPYIYNDIIETETIPIDNFIEFDVYDAEIWEPYNQIFDIDFNAEEFIIDHINDQGDAQNVHNSMIQNIVKTKFADTKCSSNANQDQVFQEIIQCAKKNKKYSTNFEKILDDIKERNAKISNINSTEMHVLINTWQTAPELQKDQIINELLDCVANEKLVCPTGVVSRIINSDVVINPNSIKTEKILREEMLNTASNLTEELSSDAEYNSLTTEEQSKIFKERLINQYHIEYENIIDRETLKKEYDQWIDNI